VLDLRGTVELGGRRHPLARPGTVVHACPFLARSVTGPGAATWSTRIDLGTAYLGFLRQGAAKLAAITELLARGTPPVLVHCTAGKDRTGIVVAVVLRGGSVSDRDHEHRDHTQRGTQPSAVRIR
jgi:hypothetical protein